MLPYPKIPHYNPSVSRYYCKTRLPIISSNKSCKQKEMKSHFAIARISSPQFLLLDRHKFRRNCSGIASQQREEDSTTQRALARKILRQCKLEVHSSATFVDCGSVIRRLRKKRLHLLAQEVYLEMKDQSLLPDNSSLSAIMLCYAEIGLLPQAQAMWEELLSSSFVPTSQVVYELIDACGKMGFFNRMIEILDEVSSRGFELSPKVYSLAISWFEKGGNIELMGNALELMASQGFLVDSAVGNSFVRYYSLHGSLSEMEAAYSRLKRSRLLLEKEGIRAMSLAYIQERKFYRLGEFLRDVGLGRKNVGNLLWNLLLLSYAVNFKMKSLQREFLRMTEAGFRPDLTTFNIRSLAFSKMSLFWDLHLSLEHMQHEDITPDVVTYGCFVDAYLDRRLARNLDFSLDKLNLDDSPVQLTDPFVFEVFGKGDFHSSSEAFLEFRRQKKWTYRELITVYLRKKYRSNQIFWNY